MTHAVGQIDSFANGAGVDMYAQFSVGGQGNVGGDSFESHFHHHHHHDGGNQAQNDPWSGNGDQGQGDCGCSDGGQSGQVGQQVSQQGQQLISEGQQLIQQGHYKEGMQLIKEGAQLEKQGSQLQQAQNGSYDSGCDNNSSSCSPPPQSASSGSGIGSIIGDVAKSVVSDIPVVGSILGAIGL